MNETTTLSPTTIDPFLLEVLRHALETVADDMALILMRTAHSSVVRDSMDFATAICDSDGQTLAQGMTTPVHLGSFYDAMRQLIETQLDETVPGDVYIFNDPYAAAGQHLPDIYIVKPIFSGDSLVGWATTIAHHSDVGGIVAGSNALGATEIYQEGLRIPIVKFMEKGIRNDAIWDLIALNVRTPNQVLGDLQAQIAAVNTGEREYLQLCETYGAETIGAYGRELHDYAEKLARAEIREIPDGEYHFSNHIDGLGHDGEPILFRVRVVVSGEKIQIDWTGTSDQVKGGINSPLPFTKACAYVAVRSILSAEVPNCHGYTRVINVYAPEGSVINPRMPGPCGGRGISGYRMIDCLFGALAQALPLRVPADGSGGSTLPTISGWHCGNPFVFCEVFMGSAGGSPMHDGQEGIPHVGANSANVPVEMIERQYPIMIEQYGYVPDTEGAGRYRGGLSIVRDYRFLGDDGLLNVRSDKRRFRPFGLWGGGEGGPSINILNPGPEQTMLPTLPLQPVPIKKGDLFRHITAGGGGWREPCTREPMDVLNDVVEERISSARARDAYGVELTERDGGELRIDAEKTEALRAERQRSEYTSKNDRGH